MKPEKQTYLYQGKERTCTIEHGRAVIATDVETQFSGTGKTPEQAVAALLRSLALPDPRAKK